MIGNGARTGGRGRGGESRPEAAEATDGLQPALVLVLVPEERARESTGRGAEEVKPNKAGAET